MLCKLDEGGYVCGRVQQMKSCIDTHENLDVVFDNNIFVDLVLRSLPSSYDNFITNYHLNSMDKTFMELYNILQMVEVGLKKALLNSQAPVLAIQNGGGKKRKCSRPKWKGKALVAPYHQWGKGKMNPLFQQLMIRKRKTASSVTLWGIGNEASLST